MRIVRTHARRQAGGSLMAVIKEVHDGDGTNQGEMSTPNAENAEGTQVQAEGDVAVS